MTKPATIIIPRIQEDTIEVTLQGTSELIIHRFAEKQISDIAAKQGAGGKPKKGKRDPEAEYEAAKYLTKDGKPGVTAIMIKAAMVGACSFIDGITKVVAKGAFFVKGEILPINHVEPYMRIDVVRLSGVGRTADLRYRPGYPVGWEVEAEILFNPDVISAEGVVNLLEMAGFSCGLGDWRPSSPRSPGPYGRFRVKAES